MNDKILKDKIEKAKKLIYRYNSFDKQKFGVVNDLDINWLLENIIGSKCIYCGKQKWTSLGCDRIDNSKPHTKDNCVCSCGRCNVIRGDRFTVSEMKKIGKTISKIEINRKKHCDEAPLKKIKRKKGKKVAKIDVATGVIVKTYKSIIETSVDGYNRSGVGKACSKYNGRSDIYRGYRWKFL